MILLEPSQQARMRSRYSSQIHVPTTRLSILDPCLEIEPGIDCCLCSETLALSIDNRPVALIPGTKLECISLNMRLSQLRRRSPRQRN